MATKTVTLSIASYTKLDTGTDTAVSMQNISDRPIRVVLSGSLPPVTATNFFVVDANEGVSRDGMTGDMYAMTTSTATLPALVTVGE